MSKNKQTYFQDAWLSVADYSSWLARATTNTKARCKLCKTNIELSNMGVESIKSHNQGKGHQRLLKEQNKLANFFKKKEKPSTSSTITDVQTVSDLTSSSSSQSNGDLQTTIPINFQDGGKLNAEIRWCLKHVLAGYSDNSITDSCELFEVMFSDSKIASMMELGRHKLKYIVNFGLAPYFKEILKKEIDSSEWFSVSFDESLNKAVQECEMDLIIRYWNSSLNKVQVRFWNSMFFGHSTAKDLVKNFTDGLSGIDLSKKVQVSMDGPSVNWKFLKSVRREREEAELNKLVDIGSCNLHSVHGALKSGCEKTGWELKRVMKGAFQLWKDSPARREDYISITGSTIFPLQFCATRWVEDQAVANRLKEIWPNIVAVIKHLESLPKSRRPSSKSYDAVVKAVKDVLICAKLSFFSFIASLLQPYLTKYQTDKPMIPFLCKDLEILHKNLMRLILKPSAFDNISGNELLKINLSDKNIYLKKKDMHLGFETEQTLQKLVVKDIVIIADGIKFKQSCREMIVAILEKITEKSPLSSPVVRNSIVFDPDLIISFPKESLRKKMKSLLHHLVSLKIISPSVSEKALLQYIDVLCPKVQEDGEYFDTQDMLDDFFFKFKLPLELTSVLKLILVLSHGQASVERGFNVNKSVVKVNISQDSVIARKMIIDHMHKNKVNPTTIEMSARLIKSVKASRQRYSAYLEGQKKLKRKTEKSMQIDILNSELQDVLSRKERLTNVCTSLDNEFVELVKLAEEKNDMTQIIKANGLKRKCEEKKAEISSFEKAIVTIEEKKQKLFS